MQGVVDAGMQGVDDRMHAAACIRSVAPALRVFRMGYIHLSLRCLMLSWELLAQDLGNSEKERGRLFTRSHD